MVASQRRRRIAENLFGKVAMDLSRSAQPFANPGRAIRTHHAVRQSIARVFQWARICDSRRLRGGKETERWKVVELGHFPSFSELTLACAYLFILQTKNDVVDHLPDLKIPRKITPCPITTVVAELRFQSALPSDAIFGAIYPSFRDEYPTTDKLPVTDIPSMIRENDPNLEFQPHYHLKSDKYFLQVGPKVFSIVRFGEYLGWAEFGLIVIGAMQKFLNLGVAKTITRTSIRYVNFYPDDVFNHINATLTIGDIQLRSGETTVRTLIEWDGFTHILIVSNIAENQQVNNGIITKTKGSILDIDTLLTKCDSDFVKNYRTLLEEMHKAEKSLFFSILKPEFVATLKPEY
jgi:uncharacterized protein (TIGR04255 family)